MLITIIFLTLLIICIVVTLIANKNSYYDIADRSLTLSFVFGMATIICFAIIICNCATKEIKYENAFYERQVLEYRLGTISENTTGNELLYNDIVTFNNDLRKVKKYANNPWTNWFNNEKIAIIDYIEIKEMTYSELVPIKDK